MYFSEEDVEKHNMTVHYTNIYTSGGETSRDVLILQ